MTEKKTTHTKKEDSGAGIAGLLLDGAIRGIQSFIDGALQSVEQKVQSITKRVAEQILLFCLTILGIVFLLVGLSQLLSATYGVPGSGESMVGVFILVTVLMVYLFDRKK